MEARKWQRQDDTDVTSRHRLRLFIFIAYYLYYYLHKPMHINGVLFRSKNSCFKASNATY